MIIVRYLNTYTFYSCYSQSDKALLLHVYSDIRAHEVSYLRIEKVFFNLHDVMIQWAELKFHEALHVEF